MKELQKSLYAACKDGHVNDVAMLLAAGADVNKANTEGQNWGYTALMSAAREGHVNIVNLLLASGAEADSVTFDGWTALMMAGSRGHTTVIKLLLERGADADKKNDLRMTATSLARNGNIMSLLENARRIRARYLLKRWRIWFISRNFWRYWYFRAVDRLYTPGAPGHEESMAALEQMQE